MKHRLSLALSTLMLCASHPLFAQERPDVAGEFRIGLSGGTTYSIHPGIARGCFPAARTEAGRCTR